MTGIQFVTDAKRRRAMVQIDLRKHEALWENLEDPLVSHSRQDEKDAPIEKVKADPMKTRRTRG